MCYSIYDLKIKRMGKMYELIQVSENCYYIESPAKIGVVKINQDEVCLIDSGNDKSAGKKVLKILNANNWKLKMILNTHSHADHIGGNKYLQEQTNCKIYSPIVENAFVLNPVLEPTFLYGGFAPKELRHKFLMAQESNSDVLTADVLPNGMKIINLSGHSYNMVGFRTADDIVYLADCISSKETLEKYQITFTYDVRSYLETLEKVKELKGKMFIPSHTPATENISDLAQYNIEKVKNIAEKILKFTETPVTFEQLLQKIFDEYNLKMTFEQYALVGSTVKSYLSWLKDEGKLTVAIQDNMLLWEKAEC